MGLAVSAIAVPEQTEVVAVEDTEILAVHVEVTGGKLPEILLLSPGAFVSLSAKALLVELTQVEAFNLAFEVGDSAKPYWLISIQTDTIAQKEV